jgi:hypothetical protein
MSDAARRARDERITLRCQLGEPATFADLVHEMERPLLYYATMMLRDEDAVLDVLQNLWLVAFRKIRRLEEPAAVRTCLYRLAHSLAVDRIRQHRSQRLNEVEGRGKDVGGTTDKDGRFRIDGMIPGFAYRLPTFEGPAKRNGKVLFRELTVQAGQTKQLGDVAPPPGR